MLNLLTKYLLQYRQVVVPSVGTIRLVQQPAQLQVADKLILPPAYKAEIAKEEAVPEHQLNFLSASLQQERSGVLQSLQAVGESLKTHVRGEGFDWKGIGLIRDNEPVSFSIPALEPVQADRVMRQDAEHNVLVGDQQMTSTQIAGLKEEEGEVTENRRSIVMIIGWILLVLSILTIAFLLYQGKFRVGSTGSKMSPTGSLYFDSEPRNSTYFSI